MTEMPRSADGLRLPDPAFWAGRQVFLTGHTGFKGAWLALWLQRLGAHVTGYALPPPSQPSLFELAGVAQGLAEQHIEDVRDAQGLVRALHKSQPEVVLHLAAQSLVRRSYREPVETYATNVMGTVHLLDAVRQTKSVRSVVVVTSDKCYENRESLWGYRESDPMGGHDPYSNSKGCAELVTSAMRRSYFDGHGGAAVASARAGNVIGGGDWAEDRLLPDAVRAFATGQPMVVRAPAAVRPWQHVFEPLRGYLLLAEGLHQGQPGLAEGWNFGPQDGDCRSVGDVVDIARRHWAGAQVQHQPPVDAPHEARFLKLDCSKAQSLLPWQPRWGLERALEETITWYHAWHTGQPVRTLSLWQLDRYGMGAQA